MTAASRRRTLFSIPGSKWNQLPWLLPCLDVKAERYLEPYGGSAAVLLNRAPAKIEAYNDLNSELVRFFTVLRDEPEELRRRIQATPYSREEFEDAFLPAKDEVDFARRFFVRMVQSSPFSRGKSSGDASAQWSYTAHYHANVAKFALRKDPLFGPAAFRLRHVQIDNTTALDFLGRHAVKEDCLVLADPPYVPSSQRGGGGVYSFEMTDEDHLRLLSALDALPCRVALCTYDNRLYSDRLKGEKWRLFRPSDKAATTADITAMHRRGRSRSPEDRSEVLWTNYEVPAAAEARRRKL